MMTYSRLFLATLIPFLSLATVQMFAQQSDVILEGRLFVGNGTTTSNDAKLDVTGNEGSQIVDGKWLSSLVKFFDEKTNGGGFRFLVDPAVKDAFILGGKNNTDFGFVTRTNLQNFERLRIKNNGNVGINEKNPQRRLHVNDVMRLEPRSGAPADPSEGDMYMDGTAHKLMVYDGTNWQACW